MYHTTLSLTDLRVKALKLGLDIKDLKQKKDYIEAIRTTYLKDIYLYSLLGTNFKSPMQFSNLWNAYNEDEINYMWNSSLVLAEEKYAGLRLLIVFYKGMLYGYGENINENGVPNEYLNKTFINGSDSHSIAGIKLPSGYTDFVLDCRIICNNYIMEIEEGPLPKNPYLDATYSVLNLPKFFSQKMQYDKKISFNFILQDCLYYGKSLISNSLQDRKVILRQIYKDLSSKAVVGWDQQTPLFKFILPEIVVKDKWNFYRSIIHKGGEGVILKSLEGLYDIGGSSAKFGWLKVPKLLTAYVGEINVFISGFVAAKKKSNQLKKYKHLGLLELSTFLLDATGNIVCDTSGKKRPYIIGYKDISDKYINLLIEVEGGYKLNPKYLGKVIKIDGCSFTEKNQIINPFIVSWKSDVLPKDCIFRISHIQERRDTNSWAKHL